MKKVFLISLLIVIAVLLVMIIVNGINGNSVSAPLPMLPNTSDLMLVLSEKYILFE